MTKITINGMELQARPNQTVLDVMNAHNIFIPTLCHMPKKETRSVCRMCIVEAEGNSSLLSACSTKVTPGMVVKTETERVNKARKVLMGCLLAEHSESGGDDQQIRDLADRLGVIKTRFSLPQKDLSRYKQIESEYIKLDISRCVHCDRCIRACKDRKVITRRGFGIGVTMAFDNDLSIEASSCIQCGDCIQACPAGAITRA